MLPGDYEDIRACRALDDALRSPDSLRPSIVAPVGLGFRVTHWMGVVCVLKDGLFFGGDYYPAADLKESWR